MTTSYAQHVFINCPFDRQYQQLFEAIVFAVSDCGFRPRCSLEIDDGSQIRIEKIFRIISDCKFGIHDISKTEPDELNNLPRFNMPLELGRNWLRNALPSSNIPGGEAIGARYEIFRAKLPMLCQKARLAEVALTFIDYAWLVSEWQKEEEGEEVS